MKVGDKLPIGKYIWTIATSRNNCLLTISEPIKGSAKSVFDESINLSVDSMQTCILQTEQSRIVFYETPEIPDEFMPDYLIKQVSIQKVSNKIFLPGISDIFSSYTIRISWDQEESKTSIYIESCGTADYTKFLTVPNSIMFRDLLINENKKQRCVEISQECLQSHDTSTIPLLYTFDNGWYNYDPIFADNYYTMYDQERWLQLCCWIDIEKYKQLPRRTQIMGFDL